MNKRYFYLFFVKAQCYLNMDIIKIILDLLYSTNFALRLLA